MKLFTWQKEFVNEVISSESEERKNTTGIMCTGSGKTIAAAASAKEILSKHKDDIILVLVPLRSLKSSWRNAFYKIGLKSVSIIPQEVASDTKVIISTYAGASNILQTIYRYVPVEKLILIFDEFHHMEENNRWANPFIEMKKEVYRHRIFISATPWHETGTVFKGLNYVGNKVKADFSYSYLEALKETGIQKNVLPVDFQSFDAISTKINLSSKEKIKFRTKDSTYDEKTMLIGNQNNTLGKYVTFTNKHGKVSQKKLRKTKYIVEMLYAGVHYLEEICENGQTYYAKGVIFAKDIEHAKGIQKFMKSEFSEKTALVTSDDPKSRKILEEFQESSVKWIISVDMISEGVDIPALSVAVDFSDKMTFMSMIQRIGRIIRVCRPHKIQVSPIYIHIAHAKFVHLTKMIQDEIKLARKSKKENGDSAPKDKYKKQYADLSGESDGMFMVRNGIVFDGIITDFKDYLIQNKDVPFYEALQVAAYKLKNEDFTEDEKDFLLNHEKEKVTSSKPPLEDLKDDLKTIIKSLTAKIAYQYFDGEFKEANIALCKEWGDNWTSQNKSKKELKKRISFLEDICDG